MPLFLKAVILGIVEGVTEFLPISSTGHLIVVSALVDYPEAQRATFDVFIQLGAVLAVLWHYRVRLLDVMWRLPSDPAARHLVLKVFLAFLPAAAVGLALHEVIEAHLFNTPNVAGALVVGGLVILLVERRSYHPAVTDLDAIRWQDAIWVGIAQVAALFPGVSRAGATIIGGLLAGLSRPAATEFSFYLALPTIAGASLFSLFKDLHNLSRADAAPLALGLVTAFILALIVIRSFITYVQSHDFRGFGYYRIIVGVILFALTFSR